MTRQEKRIRIAIVYGWSGFNPDNIPNCIQYTAKGPSGKWGMIPDYFNDLNAMHEVLSVLTDMQWHDYEHRLRDICDGMSSVEGAGRELLHSTASQQAEAFGKTLNLW